MSKLDLVIFGATGFTGKHAVEHLARREEAFAGLTWGIAGRSKKKLDELILELSKKNDMDLSGVRVIVADVSDEASLSAMCASARVLVNCCGPYRLYGEPVVRAAIRSGAHYVDVSGEPQFKETMQLRYHQKTIDAGMYVISARGLDGVPNDMEFMETMQLRYDQEARDAGVYVISACGLDSIPNDMGVVFLEQNFGGTLNSVESYLSVALPGALQREAFRGGCVNYGTWESLVYSLSHYDELRPLRKQLYPASLPAFKPKLEKRWPVHRRGGGWAVPFPGADNSVVYRTQRRRCEQSGARPVQFRAYLLLSSLLQVLVLAGFGALVFLLAQAGLTRRLLLRHPRLFSCGLVTKQGPKREVLRGSRFRLELAGRGWAAGADTSAPPTRSARALVSAADPGYGFTTLALLLSAATLLAGAKALPPPGGVLTTGAAFEKTNLIKKLQENNTTFQMIDTK